MNIEVVIPGPLQEYTDKQKSLLTSAETVGLALKKVVETYPALGPHLFNGDGGVRPFINVFLNDDDIRFLQDVDTAVGERDVIHLVPAVSGG